MKFEGSSISMAEEIKEALEKWYGTFGPLLYISFEKNVRVGRRKRLVTTHLKWPLLCYFLKKDKNEILKDLGKGFLYVTDGVRNYRIPIRDITTLEIISHQDIIQMLKTAKSNADKAVEILDKVKLEIDDAQGEAAGARFTLTSRNRFIL